MISADDGETLRLRLVDTAAAPDLCEVVDWRDFVPPRWILRAIARWNSLEDFARTADEQSAAFIGRITARVRNNRRQRFPIDSDVRQPGPRRPSQSPSRLRCTATRRLYRRPSPAAHGSASSARERRWRRWDDRAKWHRRAC